jgi:hypothetical protein
MFRKIREYSVAKSKHSAIRHIGKQLWYGDRRRAMGYLT